MPLNNPLVLIEDNGTIQGAVNTVNFTGNSSATVSGNVATVSISPQTMGGDVTGTTAVSTVVAIQNNAIESGILGSAQDGYVLAWSASAAQWQPKSPTSIAVEASNYGFSNTSSDIAGYDQLLGIVTGSQADLSAASSSNTKVLIESFATPQNNPDVIFVPAGNWEFDFYSYISATGATNVLVFDVYTRTAGGIETLIFSVTSQNITSTTPQLYTLIYNQPIDTPISSTTRIVIKVSAQSSSSTPITIHFLFDGSVNASLVRTPLVGAALQLSGDVIGYTSSSIVQSIHGASVPVAGSLTTGNVLQVNGASSLTYAPVNLSGGSNYVSGILPSGNQAAQTMNGDVTGTTASSTVARIQNVSVSSTTPTTGQVLVYNGTQWTPTTSSNTITQIEVNFGTIPTRSKTFMITDTNVSPASHLMITQSGVAATGRSSDENEMDPITFSGTPSSGQFTLIASTLNGPVVGKYRVNYMVG